MLLNSTTIRLAAGSILLLGSTLMGCEEVSSSTTDPGTDACSDDNSLTTTRVACTITLGTTNQATFTEDQDLRNVVSNSIPTHTVGMFPNSLNPNPILAQSNGFQVDLTPTLAGTATPLTNGPPQYQFGVLLNGVVLDPVAAEPWINTSTNAQNWDWNLEATTNGLGLDCNDAHVQPTGAYHYHGVPQGYIDELGIDGNTMVLIGYAADGFPLYYKYGYETATDANSNVVLLRSSYAVRPGDRPGDGISAPCGAYNGKYVADWEYNVSFGDLDECNGRFGATPEFPDGTYYYVLTDEFPYIPRCFQGTPSTSFRLGPPPLNFLN